MSSPRDRVASGKRAMQFRRGHPKGIVFDPSHAGRNPNGSWAFEVITRMCTACKLTVGATAIDQPVLYALPKEGTSCNSTAQRPFGSAKDPAFSLPSVY